MKQTSAIITFYSFIGTGVALAIAFTLYQGSLFLFRAQQLSTLEKQHQVLVAQQKELQISLAKQRALALVSTTVASDYQTIAKPVIVKLNTTVAVR